MTDLTPYLGDPLINAIKRNIVERHEKESPRDYVGASGVAEECSRKVWYGLHGYKQEFTAEVLMAIQDGHDTETKVNEWVRSVPGIELHTHNAQGQQYGFSDLNGKYKGHYDGVILGLPQSPKTWHIYEVKCVGEKYFKELKKAIETYGEKEALKNWRPTYYGQAVTYMWYEKLTRHITVVATPGARELLTVRTNANAAYAKSLRDKAERIINATEPPERIGDETYWKCRMCGFRDVCQR